MTAHQEAVTGTPSETEFRWKHIESVDAMEAFYRSILPAIREAAKECGYAIGLHGSLRRDFDLIAAPWVDKPADRDTLAAAVQRAACGLKMERYDWEAKPCGRYAVSFPICWIDWEHDHNTPSLGHIDLSVAGDLTAAREALEAKERECIAANFLAARNGAELDQWQEQAERFAATMLALGKAAGVAESDSAQVMGDALLAEIERLTDVANDAVEGRNQAKARAATAEAALAVVREATLKQARIRIGLLINVFAESEAGNARNETIAECMEELARPSSGSPAEGAL